MSTRSAGSELWSTVTAETLGRARQMQLETAPGPEKDKMRRIYELVRARIRRATYVYHAHMEGIIERPWEWEDYIKGIDDAPTQNIARE